jgi:precorrin-3B synthase
VLRPHPAADGDLIRVRLPGGRVTPAQLETVSGLAGAGEIELTSRGNLQLRAVTDVDGAVAALAAAGLLPAPSHERVRNIVASAPAAAAHRDRAVALDLALCAAPDLAELPGRVLFGLDDGRGDVAALAPDFELRDGVLVLDGHRTDLTGGVDLLIAAARAFQRTRGDAWRVKDLPGGPRAIAAAVGGTVVGEREVPEPAPSPVGWLEQPDGTVTLGAGIRLGRLPARTAVFLAAVDKPITISPWRTVYLHDLDEDQAEIVVRVLAPMGLIFDATSPWLRVSACVGDRGCARAQGDALGAAAALALGGVGERTHVVACSRGCGAPAGAYRLEVVGPTPPAPA